MQCERKEIFNSLHHLHSIAAPTAAYRSSPKQGVYVRGAACLVGLQSMQGRVVPLSRLGEAILGGSRVASRFKISERAKGIY
jgi:hypothetical protein